MSYGSSEDSENKLFVGGLSWETTKEQLENYFSTFGEVVDCALITDQQTGRSRGFGFVTFSQASAITAVEGQQHELGGRTIDPKKARARGERSSRGSRGSYGGGRGGGRGYSRGGGGYGGGRGGGYGGYQQRSYGGDRYGGGSYGSDSYGSGGGGGYDSYSGGGSYGDGSYSGGGSYGSGSGSYGGGSYGQY